MKKRFETFKKAVEADVCGRAASVQEEIEFVLARKEFPLRVTHNDTK